jgi:hypothetical protein
LKGHVPIGFVVLKGGSDRGSGKILRARMRAIGHGRDYDVRSTHDDPAILHELAEIIGSDTASAS